jgi:outer membrane immunogenic protein
MPNRLAPALIAAVCIGVFAPVASAADLPMKAPAPVVAPAPNWTGFYVGGNIGYGWRRRDVNYTLNDPTSVFVFFPTGTVPSTSFDTSGAIGGGQFGYNWQFNQFLAGLEADFNWSGMKGSNSNTILVSPFALFAVPLRVAADEDVKWFGTVRGRLGYFPADNLLAYATGGFAYGKVERSASVTNISALPFVGTADGVFGVSCAAGATCFAGASSKVATGWTVGGGLEWAVWSRWTLRAEYLYVSLGSRPVRETALNSAGFLPSSINANFGRANFNVARVGMNYRF